MTPPADRSSAAAMTPRDRARSPRRSTNPWRRPRRPSTPSTGRKCWPRSPKPRRSPVEKSQYDKYWIHEFHGNAYTASSSIAEAAKELEIGTDIALHGRDGQAARAPSCCCSSPTSSRTTRRSSNYGNKRLETNPDPDIGTVSSGNAYYLTKDFENTRRVMTDVVAKLEASGKPPDEQNLSPPPGRLRQAARTTPASTEQFEKLVTHYPKPEYWQDLHQPADRSDQERQPAAQHPAPRDGSRRHEGPRRSTWRWRSSRSARACRAKRSRCSRKASRRGVHVEPRRKSRRTSSWPRPSRRRR